MRVDQLNESDATVFQTHPLKEDVQVVWDTWLILDLLPYITCLVGPIFPILLAEQLGIASQLLNEVSKHLVSRI